MNALHFINEYIKHPRAVGAVAPSSKHLAKQMITPIDFENVQCIIEYGPGTGVFTEQLIKYKNKETKLLIIEKNKTFYQTLKDKYKELDNVYVIYGSAEETNQFIKNHKINKVDYVVSGLPFASLPHDVSAKILRVTKDILGSDGKLITFQYTRLKEQWIRSYFSKIKTNKVHWNIPPAFVFTCSN